MSWIWNFLVALVVLVFLSRVAIPLAVQLSSNFRLRATRIGLRSYSGIEWRSKSRAHDPLPTLRVERIFWSWHNSLALNVHGVTYRVHRKGSDVAPPGSGPPAAGTPRVGPTLERQCADKEKRLPPWAQRALNRLVHLLLPHWSTIASFLSIHVSDIQIIFEELDGAECRVRDVRVVVDKESACLPPPRQPLQPDEAEPTLTSSPISDTFPSKFEPAAEQLRPPPPPPAAGPPPRTRLHQRASSIHRRVSRTASHFWSTAIGSAVERATFTTVVSDVVLLRPTADKGTTGRQAADKGAPALSSISSVSGFGAIDTLLSLGHHERTLPSEDEYDKLVAIEGNSTAALSLGIGPNRPLLAEDNLRTLIDIGPVKASAGAIDILHGLSRRKKQPPSEKPPAEPSPPPSPSRPKWGTNATPRVILRAFESVSVSFTKILVSHSLPSIPMSAPACDTTGSAVTLDITDLRLQLSGSNSSQDARLAKVFGTNDNPASLIRGISAHLRWHAIELQYSDPNGPPVQLAAIRQADFDALSTWRPGGWTRGELLFSDDLNLSIIMGRGVVASVDVGGDVQLLEQVSQAWKAAHPPGSRPPPLQQGPKPLLLPPRVRCFFDIGRMSATITNRASPENAKISLATDGLSLSVHSNFEDLVSPPDQLTFPSDARTHVSDDSDNVTRATVNSDAESPDGPPEDSPYPQEPLAHTMTGEAFVYLEPVSVKISTGNGEQRRSFRLATVGRLEAKTSGSIDGGHTVLANGNERYWLDRRTLVADVQAVIDNGIKVELWSRAVLDAVASFKPYLRSSHDKESASERDHSDLPKKATIDHLPAGVSVRAALGVLSVFIGSTEVIPSRPQNLVSGLWLQTTPVIDYAHYSNTRSSRHFKRRRELRQRIDLLDDITSTAMEFANELEGLGGQAALFSVLLRDTSVRPVFNGARFVANGGADRVSQPEGTRLPPLPDDEAEVDVWGPREARRTERQQTKDTDHPPNADVAVRSVVRVPYLLISGRVHRPRANAAVEYDIRARAELVHVVCNMSDIYCTLMAINAVQHIARTFPPPSLPNPKPKQSMPRPIVSFGILVPFFWVHWTLPLRESLFVSLSSLQVGRAPGQVLKIAADHLLLHIRSPSRPDYWDEFGRLKAVQLSVDSSNSLFITDAQAMRIRLPYTFVLAEFVANLKVAIKGLKVLRTGLKTGTFVSRIPPESEPPKPVPNMKFRIELLHLEARDHPVENKLNLDYRVGLLEQRERIKLEEMFAQKVHLLRGGEQAFPNRLTANQSVSTEEARWRLDWHLSRSWIKRIKRAREEQRRREEILQNKLKIKADRKPPIHILPLEQTTPLFRIAFSGVNLSVSKPCLTRTEIIQYMGEASSPFKEDTEFSLMVPFDLDWAMDEAKVTLRDYPLPLIRIQPAKAGPSWRVTTLFVIAEELADEDSVLYVPCEVLPAQCGHPDAGPLVVDTPKTLLPVKSYARPEVRILSTEATNITWCTSYQPAISDLVRVFETFSFPVPDPSPRIGFWDKIRLILHWRVRMDFTGTARFYLKGTFDPYCVRGLGAGFALVWRRNVCIELGQPNPQREVFQIMAEECLVTIPDLGVLHDLAAVGKDVDSAEHIETDRNLILRRSRKPCARFLNGVRFGLGFQFERTCRPWTCDKCGSTNNLLHRQCRLFTFEPHQSVILKTEAAFEKLEAQLGRAVDSYEGFRSDYIHFSVSLDATRERAPTSSTRQGYKAEAHSSLHLSPKAFAHFFSWWSLFTSKIPAPIRQGRIFPDSPPSSVKFGRSMGTIKYRLALAPVYVSHVYSQFAKDLWAHGRAQSLGLKILVGRLRIDCHQRMQEKREWNERLNRVKTITHKPFYAVDLLMDDILIKGVVADFHETHANLDPHCESPEDVSAPKVSELPQDKRDWFNYFDFIDADLRPFDHNPRVQIVHLGDCPHVFLSRRVKARKTTSTPVPESATSELEASKFGHEQTHECYLGAALGVGPMQSQIAQDRIHVLQHMLMTHKSDPGEEPETEASTIPHRIATLQHHIDDLARRERRHMDDNTLESDDPIKRLQAHESDELPFENTVHVHCPRLFFNNLSRNILYKYMYSRHDRQREEYTTSHASLRGIRDGVNRRMQRHQNGLNRDDLEYEHPHDAVDVLLKSLETTVGENVAARFKLSPERFTDKDDLRRSELGIPVDCTVHPHWRALVLKPQVALRSTADDGAIVLVAVEEISYKGFAIRDTHGIDHVTSDVLSRSYIALQGLQAFYPTHASLVQPSGAPRELDFVPLEIFLDVRSETTDFERIVLKTDMSVSSDSFNHLRVPRGLEWPQTLNELGEPIDHLRRHQNLTTIIVPMVTVSATSTHFTALYYIVTDLLMYRDPEQVVRSEKIDNFVYKFDQRDRDLGRLLVNIFEMQQGIRTLADYQREYEVKLDNLNDKGKRELFNLRSDALTEVEALFTVFEVVNLYQARDDARAALKTNKRLDVRTGNVAWHMLRDSGGPLVKLNIKHTLAALVDNQDGSSDSALVIGDLQALNSNADAIFPEVLLRYDKPDISKSAQASTNFLSTSLAFLPNVGGISIIREFSFYFHPVRFRLEEEVGESIAQYIFNDRTKQHKLNEESRKPQSLVRSPSQTTLSSVRAAPDLVVPQGFDDVPDEDAAEMRRRASRNRTFVSIVIGATSLVLDYKRDDHKKRSGLSWPEAVDFRLQVPPIQFRNKVWSFEDIFEQVKREIRNSAWSQRSDIVSQVFKKTSVFRSKKGLRQIAGIETAVSSWNSKRASPKSPLRYTAQPGTPLEPLDDFSSSPESGTYSSSDRQIQSDRMDNGDFEEVIEDDDNEAHQSHRRRLLDKLRKPSKGDLRQPQDSTASVRSRRAPSVASSMSSR